MADAGSGLKFWELGDHGGDVDRVQQGRVVVEQLSEAFHVAGGLDGRGQLLGQRLAGYGRDHINSHLRLLQTCNPCLYGLRCLCHISRRRGDDAVLGLEVHGANQGWR